MSTQENFVRRAGSGSTRGRAGLRAGLQAGRARRIAPLRNATAETKTDANAAPEGLQRRYGVYTDLLRETREENKHLKENGDFRALGGSAR